MNRIAQGIVLVLLGAGALGSTVSTDLYLNYVQAGFRPFLIAAGAVLIALGAIVVAAEARSALRGDAPAEPAGCGPGHDESGGHGHGAPRVAWLLLLPVLAVFVVAPPALGSYTAENASTGEPPSEGGSYDELGEAESGGPAEMEIQEFIARAWTDEERSMEGMTVRLTGFAVPAPEGEGWYLARLQMACCAADAIVNRVLITDRPEPPEDSWWRVEGTWQPPEGDLRSVRDHRFSVAAMEEVDNPPDPYE
ncbi:TIGR03943 family putative permease subunit [Streptomonospora salina]|uniref:Putative repeat protein (TIGR03943 family) n=1 Tax=Streptomonospora salina TaxID=104205 RepID=A0A841EFX1_9ACTN|nr:TIGR03943 family protein [Streptomonospora salina]MBB6001194.1 putative repeat protein (TIGR03943 family) [Streptomonospora salina]